MYQVIYIAPTGEYPGSKHLLRKDAEFVGNLVLAAFSAGHSTINYRIQYVSAYHETGLAGDYDTTTYDRW